MNKELIKKYKAEFDWWVDGGSILYKVNGSNFNERNWLPMTEHNPVWEPNFTYIINDEYVEFRKAQAEGKIIQFYDMTEKLHKLDWYDAIEYGNEYTFNDFDITCIRVKPTEPNFPCYYKEKSSGIIVYFKGDDNPNCYNLPGQCLGTVIKGNCGLQSSTGFKWRCWDTFINPDRWEHLKNYIEEPKFKVGQSIRQIGHTLVYTISKYFNKEYRLDNHSGLVSFRLDEQHLFELVEPKFKVGDYVVNTTHTKPYKPYIFQSNVEVTLPLYSHIKLWEPQPNEWCIFTSLDDPTDIALGKFTGMSGNSYVSSAVSGSSWAYCEPFIGTLPTGCTK